MKKNIFTQGQSLVEVVLALALFTLGIGAITYLLLVAQSSSRQRIERVVATLLAEEGIEASRSIRDGGFSALLPGVHGITLTDGRWVFSGGNDTDGKYTRTITVSDISSTTKNVDCTVAWDYSLSRADQVEVAATFTDWQN
jgi:hypothetical protein